VSATVINLEDYRRKKAAEKSVRKLKGRGFPRDFNPFVGPDDLAEDFGLVGEFNMLKRLGLIPGEILDDTED